MPTMKIRVDRIILLSESFPAEAQLEAYWQSSPLEVGPTWTHIRAEQRGANPPGHLCNLVENPMLMP
jgi:hypothetical protein